MLLDYQFCAGFVLVRGVHADRRDNRRDTWEDVWTVGTRIGLDNLLWTGVVQALRAYLLLNSLAVYQAGVGNNKGAMTAMTRQPHERAR